MLTIEAMKWRSLNLKGRYILKQQAGKTMKKTILAIIISMVSTSIMAKSSDGFDYLQKPAASIGIMDNVKGGITPIIGGKCENKCNNQFRSCRYQGFPWHVCDTQRSQCLFGEG
ncbi:MAG: hypothetical protein JKY19_16520, partial [Alcanivoracaceae bacterium]|nr:hypothetical protein [Alcanivoracaceae bacterium]